MTSNPDFNDLTDEDRAAAADLRRSFSALTMDRPVPTGVAQPTYARPSKRARWGLSAAAAAAAVVAGAALLMPGAASPAWAAVPTTPSADDVAGAAAACGANLGQGLGTLEYSGSVAAPADGSTTAGTFDGAAGDAAPGGVGSGAAVPTPPTTLPPLQALDIRGTGALALYGDQDWQVSCLLYEVDGKWTSGGLTVTEAGAGAQPGLSGGGGTVRADGQTVSTLAGATMPGASKVTITLASGTTAEATVADGRYVAWFPEPIGVTAPIVRQVDANGTTLTAD